MNAKEQLYFCLFEWVRDGRSLGYCLNEGEAKSLIDKIISEAINETIERCADVCENKIILKKLLDPSKRHEALTPKHLAQAIRALKGE